MRHRPSGRAPARVRPRAARRGSARRRARRGARAERERGAIDPREALGVGDDRPTARRRACCGRPPRRSRRPARPRRRPAPRRPARGARRPPPPAARPGPASARLGDGAAERRAGQQLAVGHLLQQRVAEREAVVEGDEDLLAHGSRSASVAPARRARPRPPAAGGARPATGRRDAYDRLCPGGARRCVPAACRAASAAARRRRSRALATSSSAKNGLPSARAKTASSSGSGGASPRIPASARASRCATGPSAPAAGGARRSRRRRGSGAGARGGRSRRCGTSRRRGRARRPDVARGRPTARASSDRPSGRPRVMSRTGAVAAAAARRSRTSGVKAGGWPRGARPAQPGCRGGPGSRRRARSARSITGSRGIAASSNPTHCPARIGRRRRWRPRSARRRSRLLPMPASPPTSTRPGVPARAPAIAAASSPSSPRARRRPRSRRAASPREYLAVGTGRRTNTSSRAREIRSSADVAGRRGPSVDATLSTESPGGLS